LYCLIPEKPLRLVYETFYLAIDDALAELKSVLSGLEAFNNYPQAKRSLNEVLFKQSALLYLFT